MSLLDVRVQRRNGVLYSTLITETPKLFEKYPCYSRQNEHIHIMTMTGSVALEFLLENSERIRDVHRHLQTSMMPDVMEPFRFFKCDPNAVSPERARPSESGFDLTLISVVKNVGKVTMYGTGIMIQPPTGFYFDMVPRSSIIKSGYMLANSVGVIDQGYTGEIMVPLIK